MMATKPRRGPGRPRRFEPELKTRFTPEQMAWLEAEGKRRNEPLSVIIRECVQARMDGV